MDYFYDTFKVFCNLLSLKTNSNIYCDYKEQEEILTLLKHLFWVNYPFNWHSGKKSTDQKGILQILKHLFSVIQALNIRKIRNMDFGYLLYI